MLDSVRTLGAWIAAVAILVPTTVMAQPGDDIALIPTDLGRAYWFMDRGVACGAFEAGSLEPASPAYAPQLGLTGDRFLAGEPFVAWRNGISEIFAVRQDPFFPNSCNDGLVDFFAWFWIPGTSSGFEDWDITQRTIRFGIAFDHCTQEHVDVPFILQRGSTNDRIAVFRIRDNAIFVGSDQLPASLGPNDPSSFVQVDPGVPLNGIPWTPRDSGGSLLSLTPDDFVFGIDGANGSFDIVVYRTSLKQFFHFPSTNQGVFGQPQDIAVATYAFTGSEVPGRPGIPFVADLNADGRDDLCVWFPEDEKVIYRARSSTLSTWGSEGDFPTNTFARSYGPHIDDANTRLGISESAWIAGAVGLRADTMSQPDSDGDGVPNCEDGCPNNPDLTAPRTAGPCGCDTTDADMDDLFDCDQDPCPGDPTNTDTDNDGTPDCLDLCPTDPNKTEPGFCGCFVMEGTCDCNGNMIPDEQDFLSGVLTDCNGDLLLDQINCSKVPLPTSGRYWTNGIGSFDDPARWCSPDVSADPRPTFSNEAIFPISASGAASLTTNTFVNSMLVDAADITLDLGTQTFTTLMFTDGLVVGEQESVLASLTIRTDGVPTGGPGLNIGECTLAPGTDSVASLTLQDFTSSNRARIDEVEVGQSGMALLTLENAVVDSITANIGSPGLSGGIGDVVMQSSTWEIDNVASINFGALSIENASTLDATGGGLFVADDGLLQGIGSVLGPVRTIGEFRPGDTTQPGGDSAIGTFSISGDYDQISLGDPPRSGTMVIDVGGSGMALTADLLSVGGQLNLAGALEIDAAPEFDPEIGATVAFISGASNPTDSRFDVAFLPGLTPDGGQQRNLRVQYTAATPRGTVSVSLVVDEFTGSIDVEGAEGVTVNGVPVSADAASLNPSTDDTIDVAFIVPDGTNAGSLFVLLNAGVDGNGQWLGFQSTAQITIDPGPTEIAIGDADGMAGPDIAVSFADAGLVEIFLNDGTGSFGPLPGVSIGSLMQPSGVDFGNTDSTPPEELAVAETGADQVRVFQGQSGGMYSIANSVVLATDPQPVAVAFSNLDQDKWDDLAVANQGGNTVAVFYFVLGNVVPLDTLSLAVGSGPSKLIAAPLTTDLAGNPTTLPDLVVLNESDNTISILRNSGSRSFAPAASRSLAGKPLSVAALDLDVDEVGSNDLDLAIVVEGTMQNSIAVFRNDYDIDNDQLILVQDDPLMLTGNPTFLLAADLNDDGQSDLTVLNDDSAQPRGMDPMEDVGVLLQNPAPSTCVGDVDGDGSTGTADITFIVSNLGAGSPGAMGTPGDANGDGVTDVSDITFVVSNLGSSCL